MPLYEYVCRECNTRFEQLRPASRMDDAATCPEGHDRGERVLSVFAAITKGSADEFPCGDGSGYCGMNAGVCGGGACNLN